MGTDPGTDPVRGPSPLPSDTAATVDRNDLSGHISGIANEIEDTIGDIVWIARPLERNLTHDIFFD